jgi:hypothetical protein
LESDRNKLLLEEEDLWRQRCRTTWIKNGDLNTKYFHNLARSNRSRNHIWKTIDAEGTYHSGQQALKTTVVRHYQPFFEENTTRNLQTSVTVASLFPLSVTEANTLTLDSPCTMQEIREALKSFSKDKSPGPDSWTVEFYLHFIDLVGPDLLALVEDSRLSGKVVGALNSTFLTLIPKTNNPSTFSITGPLLSAIFAINLSQKSLQPGLSPFSLSPFRMNNWGF